ncbi:MAG: hypothetical protein KDC26_04460 [Armatimonadetes bacterium]|nr:hypothetical protein [Armatimonadota bacterium]
MIQKVGATSIEDLSFPDKLVYPEILSVLMAFPSWDMLTVDPQHLFHYRDYISYLKDDALVHFLPALLGAVVKLNESSRADSAFELFEVILREVQYLAEENEEVREQVQLVRESIDYSE